MKPTVDRSRCIGAGMCVLTAPEVFDQDDEAGTVVLRDPAPPPGSRAAARRAAHLCPSGAIAIAPDGGSPAAGRDTAGGTAAG